MFKVLLKALLGLFYSKICSVCSTQSSVQLILLKGLLEFFYSKLCLACSTQSPVQLILLKALLGLFYSALHVFLPFGKGFIAFQLNAISTDFLNNQPNSGVLLRSSTTSKQHHQTHEQSKPSQTFACCPLKSHSLLPFSSPN
jgi:hypothetical protein